MKKRTTKLVSLVLALLMICSLLPATAFAETGKSITIRAASAEIPAGEEVAVDIDIANNPGISSLKLSVSFDEMLTLNRVEYNTAMRERSIQPQTMSSPITLIWVSPFENYTADSTFATLYFTLSEEAPEGYAANISMSYDPEDVYDMDEDNVEVNLVNGKVTALQYVPGDINCDKKVNNKDVTRLFQYLAGWDVVVNKDIVLDTNGDSSINNKDLTRLFQYLAGWDVTLYPEIKTCAHELTEIEAKEATCEDAGNIAYWHCERCDKYFADADGKLQIAQESTMLAALGHDVVIDKGYPAEYGKPGLTDGSHCGRPGCGKVFVEQEVIQPLKPNTQSITYKIVDEAKHPYLGTLDIDTSELDHVYTPGKALTLKNPDFGKYGYTFDGWYDGFGDNATQIKVIPSTANETITLYAHVTEKVYDITYNTYQTPVTSAPTEAQLHYTVSRGNYNLWNPEINNYKFLGWYDENGVEYKTIPVGTTGNIVLNTYYTSLRNLAVSREDNNPLILEDRNQNVVYFTYEIGEIRNIPLNGDNPFWTIQSVAGLSQQKSETYTTTTSDTEANNISKTITDMTVQSNTMTLAKSWNEVTSVNESWAESLGKTTEQCKTEATSSSGSLSVSNQMGGSSYHKTEDGTTVYDYDSKVETKDKGHQFDASVSGTYANKVGANIGSSTEYGTEASYSTNNAYTQQGQVNAGNWSASGSSSGSQSGSASASDKDKYSAGISYENGFEVNAGLNYGYHNNTNTVTKTGSDSVTVNSDIDENTSSWNNSSTFTSTNTHSTSQTVRNTLSDIVTTTKAYGKTYSSGGTDTSTQGFSSTASNTAGTSSTVTYSKLESKTTTSTYSVDGKIEGSYRCILVGKAHVFAVVGYDYNTKSFFTYTFSVMDDKTEEFLDYTPKGGDFTDCEYSCLPFEIPIDVFDYINERMVKTTGLQYRTNSINGTAKITNYTGSSLDVIVPSYVSDGKQAYKVTELESTAFAGKPVRSVILGEFIKTIPDGAFKNCTQLESVIGSFTEIGNESFAGCEKLTNMNIPSNVVKIGENAFEGTNSIYVRAINSLSAYGQAVKELPNGTDEEIEAKQKEITLQFVQSVLDSGAQHIALDISLITQGTTLNLEVPDIKAIEISGGSKTYRGFSLKSDAEETALREMTIESTKGIPLTINSDKLTLHKVFVNANAVAVLLKKDGVVLSLSQDSTIRSTSDYTVISKNPVIESLVSTGGAAGYLNVIGNFGYVNSIRGSENIDIEDGRLIEISDEEFQRYIQGFYTIHFDANDGILDAENESMQVFVGAPIENLPVPTRDYYTFDGWYTEAEGGEQVNNADTMSVIGDTTLYAHWTLNELSDWVLASELPEGAEVTADKYIYDVVTTDSTMKGYTKKTSVWSAYGSWSDWQTGVVNKSESRDVATETRSRQVYDHTEWNYSRWQEKNPSAGAGRGWTAWAQGWFSGYNCQYYVERGWGSRLSVDSWDGDHAIYKDSNGSWYNETSRTVNRTENYTVYRYRDRHLIYTYTFESEIVPTGEVSNLQHWIQYRVK